MESSDFRSELKKSVLNGLVLIIGSIIVLSVLLALDVISVLITTLVGIAVIIGGIYTKRAERKNLPVV